jgi:hypothetical protein
MENHSFGDCPICGQGQLVAMKSASTGQLLIMCDDCESQWQSPDAAQSFENALSNEIRDVQKASLDEIKESGWLT